MGVPRYLTVAPRRKYLRKRSISSRLPELPQELVVCILEFLNLHDLRAAAAVGRVFYAAAWRAGLYIERTFESGDRKNFDSEIQTRAQLVQHALRKDLRLALTVDIPYDDDRVNPSNLAEMLRVISSALPVLVFLSLAVGMGTPDEFFAALRAPAPRLRSLSLRPPSCRITNDFQLFSGSAPQLRELLLGCLFDGAEAIPAFANVVRFLAVSWDAVEALQHPLHLPKLAHLYVPSSSNEPDLLPHDVDFASMSLRSLAVHDFGYSSDDIKRSLRDPKIPVAHYYAFYPWRFDWRGWNGDSGGSLSVHIAVAGVPLSVRVVPADRSWRRSYSFNSDQYDAGIPIGDMSGLPARLEYLRMHCDTVLGFLLCAAEFPALKRVRVDVRGWSSAHGPVGLFINSRGRYELEEELEKASFRVRCPALETIALTILPARDPLTVELDDLAFLCRALTDAKPALELCGVEVAPSHWSYSTRKDDDISLDDLFSTVTSSEPTSDVFEGGEWDDVNALVELRYLRQSLASHLPSNYD